MTVSNSASIVLIYGIYVYLFKTDTIRAMLASGEITLTICFTVLVFPGLIGNILVCLVVFSNRTMQTPINYLFVNLAVADIITLTFIGPQYIFTHFFKHPTGTTGDFLCKFITGVETFHGLEV